MQDDFQSFTSSVLSDNPMMTEAEAQNIIQNYNVAIQALVKENEQQLKKMDELNTQEKEEEQKLMKAKKNYEAQTKRMELLKQKQFKLDQEREELFSHPFFKLQKTNNPKLMQMLYEYLHSDYRASLASIPHIDSSQNSLMQFDDEEEETTINPSNPQILNELVAESQIQHHKKADLITKILEQIYKYAELQVQKCQKKECSQCHQMYNPRTNYQDSCLFHSGKLKFYSCKKCGADDYYTCCNKCIRCSEGCKTSQHQPMP